MKDTYVATSERVLLWSQRVEAQRVHEEAPNGIKESKEFDSVGFSTQKHDSEAYNKQK